MSRSWSIDEIVKYSMDTSIQEPDMNNWLNRWLMHLTDDSANIYFIRHYIRLLLFFVPVWICVLILPFSMWTVLFYLLAYFTIGKTLLFVMHASSHRRLLKKQYGWLDKTVYYLNGFAGGFPPEYFSVIHIPDHHASNNNSEDLACTMHLDRSSWKACFMYTLRHIAQISGFIGLILLLKRKERKSWMNKLLFGQLCFWLVAAIIFYIDWRKGISFFVVPYILAHFSDRFINWFEHVFVNPNDPLSSYGNSIIVLGKENQKMGNTFYHAVHHLRPKTNELEQPRYFEANIQKFIDRKCLLFYDMDHFSIILHLWTKNFDYFYNHFIRVEGDTRSKETIIEDLKNRLNPIQKAIV